MNTTIVIIDAGKEIRIYGAWVFQHSSFNLALASRMVESLKWLKE